MSTFRKPALMPLTEFTETEKKLAKQLKESGLSWHPEEGDWFWAVSDVSHQFYLGESLPSSFSFAAGGVYVYESSMTWHVQQGGLKLDSFVWLPSWSQGREILRKNGYRIHLRESEEKIEIEAFKENRSMKTEGQTDLEALYGLIRTTTYF